MAKKEFICGAEGEPCTYMENKESKITVLQYINTVILTIVGIFAVLIFLTVSNVGAAMEKLKTEKIDSDKELLRIKTVQDINTAAISDVKDRVDKLELNYLDYIKTWVDQNYMRKPQK